MLDFKEYIADFGLNPSSIEEWQEVKKMYRKYYQQQYHKNYRNQLKRVEILFSRNKYEKLKNIAEKYDEKPTTFIRKSSLAYIQSEVFLPINENIEEVKILIRRSSNNINQLVYHSHYNKSISKEQFMQLVAQVNQLETIVNTLYASPKIIFKPIHLISEINVNKDAL